MQSKAAQASPPSDTDRELDRALASGPLVLGVAVGTGCWYAVVAGALGRTRWVGAITRGVGALLAGYGVALLFTVTA